jgi:hypothetical protein
MIIKIRMQMKQRINDKSFILKDITVTIKTWNHFILSKNFINIYSNIIKLGY